MLMMSRNFSPYVQHQASSITESLIITGERIQIKCHLQTCSLIRFNPPPNPISATQQTLIPKDRKVVAMETTQACFHPLIDEVLCDGPDVARKAPVPHSGTDPSSSTADVQTQQQRRDGEQSRSDPAVFGPLPATRGSCCRYVSSDIGKHGGFVRNHLWFDLVMI